VRVLSEIWKLLKETVLSFIEDDVDCSGPVNRISQDSIQKNPRQIGARVVPLCVGHLLRTLQGNAALYVDDRYYFHRSRIDDHHLIADHEIFEAAPFRFDFHNGPWKSSKPHGPRHSGAD
jgi:hypothetical protein